MGKPGDTIRQLEAEIARLSGRIAELEAGQGLNEAREAQQASEARYRTLFETMLDGFALHEIILDETGTPVDYRFLEVNPAFETLTGLRAEYLLGRTVREVLPTIEPHWIERYGKVALTGEPARFESYAQTLDKVYQVYTYSPRQRQFAVLFTDITEQKRAEEKLASIARFPGENPYPVLRISADGEVLFANPASAALLSLWQRTGGQAVPANLMRVIRQSLEEQALQQIEVELDQTIYSLTVIPFAESRYANLYAADITSLKATEDRLLLAKSAAGFGIFDYSLVSGKIEGDERVCELWGFQPGQEITIEMIHAGIHPDDRVITQAALDSAMDLEQEGKYAAEYRVINQKDGMTRWIAASGAVFFEHGQTARLVATVEDITQRKKTEQALIEYAARLEQSNQDLERFAVIASHDLQEPLRKINAFGTQIQSRIGAHLDDESKDYLIRIQKASVRMQQMIQGLLVMSRITTQGRPFVSVDLNEVVKAVLSDMEPRLGETQAEIEVGPLPEILADPAQMHQLFQNLLVNAVKFQKPGNTARVKVYAKESPAESSEGVGELTLYVEDNGIGFEQSYAGQVFYPFERLVGRSQYEGSGIGLAICKKIVERHGGTISARSTPNAGSTFIVTLPSGLRR